VAVLAAASAAAVAVVALGGTGEQTAVVGASGLAVTAAGGGLKRSRRHRGHHRTSSAPSGPITAAEPAPGAVAATFPSVAPAVAVAMSAPPAPETSGLGWPPPAWTPPAEAAPGRSPLGWPVTTGVSETPAATVTSPSLFLVPPPDPMTDTVPHPVVKLFPLADLEPDVAAGTIDEQVYAAIDAERRLTEAAALASGRHASTKPIDAAAPRAATYRSRHSA
jgi:hypothetical protein